MVDKPLRVEDVTPEMMEVIAEAAIQANANNDYMRKELEGLPPEAFTLAMNLGSFIVHCAMNGVDLIKYEKGSLPREMSQTELAKLRVDFVKHFFLGSRNTAEGAEATPAYVNQG